MRNTTRRLSSSQRWKQLLRKKQKRREEKAPHKDFGFVTISAGEGLSEIFKELGVDEVIEGGQTMNPSTEDILNAADRINADTDFCSSE